VEEHLEEWQFSGTDISVRTLGKGPDLMLLSSRGSCLAIRSQNWCYQLLLWTAGPISDRLQGTTWSPNKVEADFHLSTSGRHELGEESLLPSSAPLLSFARCGRRDWLDDQLRKERLAKPGSCLPPVIPCSARKVRPRVLFQRSAYLLRVCVSGPGEWNWWFEPCKASLLQDCA
jgi:hypothetical protein